MLTALPSLQSSILLRIEVMERREACAEDMLELWNRYAELKQVLEADVDRILQVLAVRERQKLLRGEYLPEVILLLVQAVLAQKGVASQQMIGKLLLALIDGIQNAKPWQEIESILNSMHEGTGRSLAAITAHLALPFLCPCSHLWMRIRLEFRHCPHLPSRAVPSRRHG